MHHLGPYIAFMAQAFSAILAFTASYYWLRSAEGVAPPMTWAGISDLKPWLNQAASRNRWAAIWAAASACAQGVAILASLY